MARLNRLRRNAKPCWTSSGSEDDDDDEGEEEEEACPADLEEAA